MQRQQWLTIQMLMNTTCTVINELKHFFKKTTMDLQCGSFYFNMPGNKEVTFIKG